MPVVSIEPECCGGPIAWTVLEFAATSLAFLNSCSISFLMGPIPAANEYFGHSGSLLSMAIVVYVFARQRGYLARFLSLAPLVYLGEISFSIYLLHALLYGHIRPLMPESVGVANLIFVSLLIGSAAVLMHFAVEGPMRKCLRKWLSKPKQAEANGGGESAVPAHAAGAERVRKAA